MAQSVGSALGISRPSAGSGHLGYAQLKQLWIQNGGNPAWAPTMAFTALLESGGNYGPTEINNNPATGDLSAGLWQINYFGNLGPSRTSQYGSISTIASDPNANARAAISLLGNGSGISNWPNTGAPAVAANGGPLSDGRAQALASTKTVPYGPAGSPGVPATSGTGSGGGCSAKGNVFSEGGIFGLGSFSFTYCNLKAITGSITLLAGGGIMLVGAAMILVSGLGSKVPAVLGGAVAGRIASKAPAAPEPPEPSPEEFAGSPDRRGSATRTGQSRAARERSEQSRARAARARARPERANDEPF